MMNNFFNPALRSVSPHQQSYAENQPEKTARLHHFGECDSHMHYCTVAVYVPLVHAEVHVPYQTVHSILVGKLRSTASAL